MTVSREDGEKILGLIRKSKIVRIEALSSENVKGMGYHYYAGYATLALEEIESILKRGE